MVELFQAALAHHGIEDTVLAVGQFEPRGMSGSMFAGAMIGDEVGGSVGLGAGALAGRAAGRMASGLPSQVMVGVTRRRSTAWKAIAGARSPARSCSRFRAKD